MAKASQKKLEYIANYDVNNYERVLIRFEPGTKAAIMATGAKSVNGYVTAAVRDRLKGNLDNPPPVETQPAQPHAVDPNTITVQLDPQTLKNMDGAIGCNYSTGRVEYITRAVNEQLRRDIETEKEKRRAARSMPPDE